MVRTPVKATAGGPPSRPVREVGGLGQKGPPHLRGTEWSRRSCCNNPDLPESVVLCFCVKYILNSQANLPKKTCRCVDTLVLVPRPAKVEGSPKGTGTASDGGFPSEQDEACGAYPKRT